MLQIKERVRYGIEGAWSRSGMMCDRKIGGTITRRILLISNKILGFSFIIILIEGFIKFYFMIWFWEFILITKNCFDKFFKKKKKKILIVFLNYLSKIFQ